MFATVPTFSLRPKFLRLQPVESLALALCLVVVVFDGILSISRSVAVAPGGFAANALAAAALVAVAQWYRKTDRNEPIAASLMACGILILFTNAGAILNYLIVPVGRATIDPLLVAGDRALGFSWHGFAEAMAGQPLASRLLGVVYQSSLAQMAATMIVLGLTGRTQALHRFVLCGIFASLIAICFWGLFPSIGPASITPLGERSAQALGPILDSGYVTRMRDLLAHGVTIIRSEGLDGLVAFPSMHTVMMLMTVWYLRGTRIWPLAIALAPAMVPAILIHGNHNLVDVLGGTALFGLAAGLSAHIEARLGRSATLQTKLAPLPG